MKITEGKYVKSFKTYIELFKKIQSQGVTAHPPLAWVTRWLCPCSYLLNQKDNKMSVIGKGFADLNRALQFSELPNAFQNLQWRYGSDYT